MRWRGNQIATLTVVALAMTLLLVAAGGRGAQPFALRAAASSWRGLFGARPQVALGDRMIVVLRAPSLADRAGRGAARSIADERRFTAGAYAAQQQLLARLAAKGARIAPAFRYAHVLNGFSAALDARSLALLEADADVAGVYPVRAAYPAEARATGAGAATSWGGGSLPGFDGRGVTIALLDTGVDLGHPYLRGHVQPGIDLIGSARSADARARPDGGDVERHGTEIAGLLVGRGGGLEPAAPGATLLPIRVAGWQQDAQGAWAVFGRTDQLVAGIDRAVDPNDDGAVDDAAKIVLVPLAVPFAAFADDPTSRAAAGAARLGSLVVAPAGNDGPAGAVFGSVGAPGGAPAALTIGAADTRLQSAELRITLRSTLDVLFSRALPLAGSVAPPRAVTRRLVAVGGGDRAPVPVRGFFDANGYSRVAGRVVLAPVGNSPETTAQDAARAGAVAVLLYGGRVPPGALGTSLSVPIPTAALPGAAARATLAALRRGMTVNVSIGTAHILRNSASGRVASFSSRGLSFDGRMKPELLAPGVGLTTAEPSSAGAASVGSVNGTSAAAGLAAGAAAILLQARPGLDPSSVKSLLLESAKAVWGDSVAAQGAGLLDIGRAAAIEVATAPAAVALGPAVGAGALRSRRLIVRNVSTRRLIVYTSVLRSTLKRVVRISVSPSRFEVAPGASASLVVSGRVSHAPGTGLLAQGLVLLTPVGGAPARVPWVVGFRLARPRLLGDLRLSAKRFSPSLSPPSILSFAVGRVLTRAGATSLQPVSRLDVELWTTTRRPRRLGLLARLRDVLPGRPALGLTGYGPDGKILARGTYRLRLVAFPTAGGPASRRSVLFTVD